MNTETVDIMVWGLQGILMGIFLYFGASKLFLSQEAIAKKVSWAHDYSKTTLNLFGVLEIIGALGLVLPYRLDIFPILTPMAATGLAMMMGGSIGVHLRRDEIKMIFINILMIFLLAGVGFHTLIDIFDVQIN